MISMISYELKKILHNQVVIGSIVGLLLICFILLNAYCFNNPTNTTTTPEGTQLFGRNAITYNQAIASRYSGTLTDKTIARMMLDFQKDYPKEYDKMRESGLLNASIPSAYLFLPLFVPPDHYNKPVRDLTKQISLTPSLSEHGLVSIHEVGFYPADNPPQYGYSDSWLYLFSACCGPNFSIAIPVFIVMIIATSAVFSGEYNTKTSSLILTTRYGKNKLILAKIMASMVFATLLLGGIFLLFSMTFGIHYGYQGWDAGVQTNFGLSLMGLRVSLNHLKLILLGFSILWLGSISLVALTLMISAMARSPFSSLVISTVFFIIPRIIRQSQSGGTLHDLLLIFPINLTNVQEVLHSQLNAESIYHSDSLSSLAWIILTTALVTLVSGAITHKAFTNHEISL